ncbi:helix-turn-helix transcriptional regulator [Actinoallomurus sp. CA-150999]|uniref:helix-turn-helix transcriptional regulator n=1 Tax=Actinoallomurus sp. CA-150999 TaxID=3239887 RepID=UPI003D937D44
MGQTPARSFIGRRRENETLTTALDRAAGGSPQVVLVGGEAGVGKTRLVERFTDAAEDSGALVLSGACVKSGLEGLPLAPIIMALRGLVDLVDVDRLISLFPGLPELAQLFPELGLGPAAEAPTGQARLFHQFAVFVERLGADRPVVILVEDLHWADRSTRALLDVLARNLRDTCALIVATYRTDDLYRGHPLRPYLAELNRVEGVQRIELGRFSRAETAELIASALGAEPSPAFIDRIFDRSGGNAFFVEELIRVWRSGMSPSLDDSLRDLLVSRIERLPEPTQRVIRLVSIERSWVSHQVVAAVADMSNEALLDALRSAIDAYVLAADGEGYDFRHALVREAVVDELLPGERIQLHRTYALALEGRPELLPPEHLPSSLAYHWAGVGEPTRELPALLRAAAVAKALSAHVEQYQLLRRALDLSAHVPEGADRHELEYEASHAAWLAGEHEEGLVLTEQALANVDRARQPERAALLLARRGRLLLRRGHADAVPALEEAARLVPTGTSVTRGTVLEILGSALTNQGDAARGGEVSGEAVRIARALGDYELQVAALTTQGTALAYDGRHEYAVAAFEAARALAKSRGDLPGLTRASVNLSVELWAVGRYTEAVTVARDGLDAARRSGLSATAGAFLTANLGMALFSMGRWDEAAAAIESSRGRAGGVFVAYLHLLHGDLALARGDLAAAKGYLSLASSEFGPNFGHADGLLPMARLDAEIALRENRIDHARRALARALDAAPVRGQLVAHIWALIATGAMIEVRARERLGAFAESPEVESLTEVLSSVAADLPTDMPPWHAYAEHFAAELDSLERVSPAWHGVVTAWEKAGNPHLACYARVRAAEAAIAIRDNRTARGLLTSAAKEAGDLGAGFLTEEIDALARSVRLSISDESDAPEETRQVDMLGLTPREVDVFKLLTDGHSNRDIGTRLFITEKTASVHVSRILAKLGVTNRGEAAAMAHRLRLFDG